MGRGSRQLKAACTRPRAAPVHESAVQRAAPLGVRDRGGIIGHALILVIVGAGASFDSWSAYPPPHTDPPNQAAIRRCEANEGDREAWRPPLADHLFEPRRVFLPFALDRPAVRALAPQLRPAETGVSVEAALAEIEKEAGENPIRIRQVGEPKELHRDVQLRHLP